MIPLPSPWRIEASTAGDLPHIAALAAVIWRAHYPGIISPAQVDYMLGRMYDLGVMQREMAEGITYWHASIDRTMVGFASAGLVPGPRPESGMEMKLHKLYVDPGWQRRGIGAALLGRVQELALRHGARSLILNVNKRNEGAIAAYKRHGFRFREEIVVDIGGGFVMDDYVMAKEVAA